MQSQVVPPEEKAPYGIAGKSGASRAIHSLPVLSYWLMRSLALAVLLSVPLLAAQPLSTREMS
ncbi:MAG TPA: hypothetical protein VN283_10825, partial [Thiobacillus sp.]|nr:hypothetical protein [Thiobacillus sp.]